MRRWSFFFGAILIILGVFSLLQVGLNVLGLAFRIWWIFWPIVLIAAGLWLISGFFRRSLPSAGREETSIPLEGATEAAVAVHHGAGRLFIGGGLAGAANLLLAGTFGGGLDTQRRREGNRLVVDMRVRDRDVFHYIFPWARGRSGLLDWDFTLSTAVPLFLNLETGASDSRLSLANLQLRELHLKTGASSTTVELPAAGGFTRVIVESGAAAVRLRVPSGVAASIQVRSALAGIHVNRQRFPETAGGFRSPDYDRAANKVDISIDTGMGAIEVT